MSLSRPTTLVQTEVLNGLSADIHGQQRVNSMLIPDMLEKCVCMVAIYL